MWKALLFYVIQFLICLFTLYVFTYIVLLLSNKKENYRGRKFVIGFLSTVLTVILVESINYHVCLLTQDIKTELSVFSIEPGSLFHISQNFLVLSFFAALFMYEYYKQEDPDIRLRISKATQKPVTILAWLFGLSLLTYVLIGEISYDTNLKILKPKFAMNSGDISTDLADLRSYPIQRYIGMSFYMAYQIIMAMFTQFVFSCFGAIAIVFFPLMVVKELIYTPKDPDPETQVMAQKVLLEKTQNFLKNGEEIYKIKRELQLGLHDDKKQMKRRERFMFKKLDKLNRQVYIYQDQIEYLNKLQDPTLYNPITHYLKLVAVFLIMIVSFLFYGQVVGTVTGYERVLQKFLMYLYKQHFLYTSLFHMAAIIGIILSVSFTLSKIFLYFPFFNLVHPVKKNLTYDDTMLAILIVLIPVYLGFNFFYISSSKQIYGDLPYYFWCSQVLKKGRILRILYDKNVFDYCFMLMYSLMCFVAFFIQPNKVIIEEEIQEFKERLESNQVEKLFIQINQLILRRVINVCLKREKFRILLMSLRNSPINNTLIFLILSCLYWSMNLTHSQLSSVRRITSPSLRVNFWTSFFLSLTHISFSPLQIFLKFIIKFRQRFFQKQFSLSLIILFTKQFRRRIFNYK